MSHASRDGAAQFLRWALGGWLLDLLARRVPDVRPIVFDEERSEAHNRVVELASVSYVDRDGSVAPTPSHDPTDDRLREVA